MSERTYFRTTRAKISPRWLTNGVGGLVGYSLDIMKDAIAERTRLSLLARFPDFCPDDALPLIGRDRRVVRGISESRESYAARLKAFLDDWRYAGTPYNTLDRLAAYLGPLPKIRIVNARGNWFTREPSGAKSYALNLGNWNWDGPVTASNWSRYWVIIYPNGLWSQLPAWGDSGAPAWGNNDVTWGSTATPEHVKTVRHIVRESKRAGSICENIIVSFNNAIFDPATPTATDGLYGHWSKNVGGVQVPARHQDAIYWDGVKDQVFNA